MALAGWTRRVKLTVPAANVSGITPDFPVLVTRDCLPDEVCDPSSPNAAQVGGGDLRVTLTDDTVIPLEIAAFGHDSSSGAGDAQVRLWFLAPLLSTSGDKEFYLYYNAETTQSQPSVTDPTGRNAVWADFHRVYHLDEETGDFVDSTGSSADGVVSGTVTRGVVVGALKGVDFGATGHTNYIDAPSLGDQSTTFAVSCWVDLDATQGNWCGIVADGDDVGNGGIVVQREFNTNDLRVYYNGLEYYNDLTSAFSSIIGVGDTLLHVAVTPDSLINVYKNAFNIATDSTQESSAAAATTPTLKIGNARNGGNGIGGVIAELRIRPGALTLARMEAERDNQSLPATFISPGTPEDVGSSGAGIAAALAPAETAAIDAALTVQHTDVSSVFVTDSFTDVDGTLLADHTGELGGGWVITATEPVTIIGGAVRSTHQLFNLIAHSATRAPATNHAVEARVRLWAWAAGAQVMVLAREDQNLQKWLGARIREVVNYRFAVSAMNYTDGTLLEDVPGLSEWVKRSATGSARTLSNRLFGTAAGTDEALVYSSTGTPPSADYAVRALVQLESLTGAGVGAGLVARNDASAGGGYQLRLYVSGDDVYAELTGAAAPVNLGAAAVGSVWDVLLQCEGSTIRVVIDAVERFNLTDTTYTAAGEAGLLIAGNDSWSLDNYQAFGLPDYAFELARGQSSSSDVLETYPLGRIAMGSEFVIRVEVEDDTTRGYLDGVLRLTHTGDQPPLSDGFVGFFYYSRNMDGWRLDNFWAGPVGQSSAGDFAAEFGAALAADSIASLDVTLGISEGASVSASLSAPGVAVIDATLGVAVAPQAAGDLNASAGASLDASVLVTDKPDVAGSLSVSSEAQLQGAFGLTDAPEVSGALQAVGTTALSGTLTLNDAPPLAGDLMAPSAAQVSGVLTLIEAPSLTGALVVPAPVGLVAALSVTSRPPVETALVAVSTTALEASFEIAEAPSVGGALTADGQAQLVAVLTEPLDPSEITRFVEVALNWPARSEVDVVWSEAPEVELTW